MSLSISRQHDLSNFITTTHSSPYPAISFNTTWLPNPYTVLVLGASRGIGAGIAYAYASAGASALILSSRRTSGLQEVAAKCRSLANPETKIEVLECDIASAESVAALADKIRANFARLDVVVVNAGYSGDVELQITSSPPADFQQCVDVNYVGTYHAMHYLIPLLLDPSNRPAAFVAIGSLAAPLVGGPVANAQYCVSKLAQARLVELVALQYCERGLLVLSVHPGAVATEMARESKGAEEFMQCKCGQSLGCEGRFLLTSEGDRLCRQPKSLRCILCLVDQGCSSQAVAEWAAGECELGCRGVGEAAAGD